MSSLPSVHGAVRRAGPTDAEALVRIARDSFSVPWSADAYRDQLARKDTRALLARDAAGEPVAYALGRRALETVDLLSFAVAADHRRGGVGRSLLRAFVDGLRDEGVERLWLEVRASNTAARGLYEQFGFKEQSVRRAYYSDGETALLLGTAL